MVPNLANWKLHLQVRYYVRDQHNNSSSILTKKEESSLVSLRQSTDYGFQVRAKTSHGWGKYSPPIYKKTGQLLGTGKAEYNADGGWL